MQEDVRVSVSLLDPARWICSESIGRYNSFVPHPSVIPLHATMSPSAIRTPSSEDPMAMHSTRMPPALKLRQFLASSDGLMVCPGVYDGLSARIALDVGFEGLYMVCGRSHERMHCQIMN